MNLLDQINALTPDERHTTLVALGGMVHVRQSQGRQNDAFLLATALDAAMQLARTEKAASRGDAEARREKEPGRKGGGCSPKMRRTPVLLNT